MSLFFQLLANGLVTGATYALVAIGFGIVYRSTRVFHLAYGGVYTCAAYGFYVCAALLDLPVFVAGLFACGLAVGVGMLMEAGVYWPFFRRGAAEGSALLASLGIYLVLENGLAMVFGSDVKTVSTAVLGVRAFGPVRLTPLQFWELVLCGGLVAGVWVLVRRATVFKALWVVGDEPDLAQALGLPYRRLRLLALALSSLLIALPACLGGFSGGVVPYGGMDYLLVGAVVVFSGGLDSMAGWVLSGFALGVLKNLVLWQFSSQWTEPVTFFLLIILLLTRSRGLIGLRRRAEEA